MAVLPPGGSVCPYPCVVTGSPGQDVCGVSEHRGLTVEGRSSWH